MEIERKREWHRQLAWLERRDLEKEPWEELDWTIIGGRCVFV